MLFELFRRMPIHPVQYTLVGLALAMFFLLLTALSEHIAFGIAYVIATLACVGLIGAYVAYVLRSANHRALRSALRSARCSASSTCCCALKTMRCSPGSTLLFGLLAGLMMATRRVDWYQLTRRPPKPVSAQGT
jgi:inner membrane protein